jgi:hypothetical protein
MGLRVGMGKMGSRLNSEARGQKSEVRSQKSEDGGRRESLKRYIVEAELQPTRLPPQSSGTAGDEGRARSARDYNPRTPVSKRSTSSGVV